MKTINKFNVHLRPTGSTSLFHDSRQDIRNLMKVCNALIDKCNELTERVNILTGMLEEKIEEE